MLVIGEMVDELVDDFNMFFFIELKMNVGGENDLN